MINNYKYVRIPIVIFLYNVMTDPTFVGWYQINEKEPSYFNEVDNNEKTWEINVWTPMYWAFNEEEHLASKKNESTDDIQESEEYFRSTEQWKALEASLWLENKDIFNEIVSKYSTWDDYLEPIDAIKEVILEKEKKGELIFENEQERKKLVDTLVSAYLWENVDSDLLESRSDFGIDVSPEQVKYSPVVPILERIVPEIAPHISEALLLEVPLNQALEDNIEDSEMRAELKGLLESIDNTEENVSNFEADFAEEWKILDPECDDVIKIIAESYIKFPDKNGENNRDLDLSTAIRVAANKMIEKSSGISKTSDGYKKAIKNIESDNSAKQLEGLRFLFKETTADKGKGKLTKDQNKRFSDQKARKTEEAEKRIEDIKNLLKKARKNWNEKKVNEQKQEAKALQQELVHDDSSEWEVMSGWKEDVLAQLDSILKEETI